MASKWVVVQHQLPPLGRHLWKKWRGRWVWWITIIGNKAIRALGRGFWILCIAPKPLISYSAFAYIVFQPAVQKILFQAGNSKTEITLIGHKRNRSTVRKEQKHVSTVFGYFWILQVHRYTIVLYSERRAVRACLRKTEFLKWLRWGFVTHSHMFCDQVEADIWHK